MHSGCIRRAELVKVAVHCMSKIGVQIGEIEEMEEIEEIEVIEVIRGSYGIRHTSYDTRHKS